MTRPDAPPEMSFFASRRAAAGDRAFVLQLDDLEIELAGLHDDLADRLAKRFGSFAAGEASSTSGALRVRFSREDRDYFIDPAGGGFNRILLACDGYRMRYLGHQVAGWFDTRGGEGRLLLAGGDYEQPEGAVENYLRAAVAWQAAERGGALIHAASGVFEDRAYVFYGESGAGKSTLAECNRRARILSDDLTLALPAPEGGLDLVGSPFRGTYTGGPQVLGRFPLAAGFRLVQSSRADVRQVTRAVALSELVGNLPFVAECFSARPDLFAAAQRSFAGVPLAHLHFRKDDSYWDAIGAAGL